KCSWTFSTPPRSGRSMLPEANADTGKHPSHLSGKAAQIRQLLLQRRNPGVGRDELGVRIWERVGRRTPIDPGTELPVLVLKPIKLVPILLALVEVLSLELVERHPQPPRFHLEGIPLDGAAVTLGDDRYDLRLAVPDDRRQPIGLEAERIGLGAKPIDFGAEPVDFGAERIHFGAEPIDLGAVLLSPFVLFPLEPGDRDAEPLGIGCDLLLLGP